MKFFIPKAKDDQAVNIYNSIKKFVFQQIQKNIFDTKIYKITFKHNGKDYSATIGEITKCNNEMAIAIFETDDLYLLCTPNRGVRRGIPILISKNFVSSLVEFKN